MKRVISLALVICLVLLLLTPASYAFTFPDDFETVSLSSYLVSSETDSSGTVTSSYVFPYPGEYLSSGSFVSSKTFSASHSVSSYKGYNSSFSILNSCFGNGFNGNECFDFSEVSAGSNLIISTNFDISNTGSNMSVRLGFSPLFYNSSGNYINSNNTLDCNLYSSPIVDTIQSSWSATINSGSYKVPYTLSTVVPEGACYFDIVVTIGFTGSPSNAGCSFSVTFDDVSMTISGVPYPTQPTISYNWSDTGAATYSLGTTTGSPLQVHVTNPQSYGSYSYQWYSGQFNKYDSDHLYGYGTAIEGATSAVYMPPVDHLGTYWYYCIVGHESGDNMAYTHTSDCLVTVVDPASGGSGVDPTDPSDPSGGGSGTDPGGDSTDTTDPSDPSGGGSGDDSGGDSGGGATTPSAGNEEVVEGIEEANSWLERVVQGITNLPDKILDGIKSLFVPDAESMAEYKEQWEALLSQRFGAIYESVQLIDDFVSSIELQSTQGYISFPEVSVDLVGTTFTFGGWNVQVVPSGFEAVVEILKKIISIIATLAFINSMRRKFEMVLGGSE